MGGDFSEVMIKQCRVEGAILTLYLSVTHRRLNLRSESSSRFEKGIATEFVNEAVDRALFT